MPVEEYQFSRFNKKLQLIKYTDEEYTKYLACTEWTKQVPPAMLMNGDARR